MNNASEALLALKPVTFRYKKEIDPQGIPQFGLVAEEVEKVNPKLVVRDKDGKVNTVRYEAVNAMLLNEFLKEHKKVEQLEATVAQQRKDFEAGMARQQSEFETTRTEQQNEIEILIASFEEQAAQIQKVNALLEVSKPAPRIVANRP